MTNALKNDPEDAAATHQALILAQKRALVFTEHLPKKARKPSDGFQADLQDLEIKPC